jgi:hypothetical protein
MQCHIPEHCATIYIYYIYVVRAESVLGGECALQLCLQIQKCVCSLMLPPIHIKTTIWLMKRFWNCETKYSINDTWQRQRVWRQFIISTKWIIWHSDNYPLFALVIVAEAWSNKIKCKMSNTMMRAINPTLISKRCNQSWELKVYFQAHLCPFKYFKVSG